MEYSFVYMTAGDMEEAKRIGKTLVAERLAACANCIPAMESVYWWEGKMEESSEVVVILKTRSSLVESLTKRAKELHSYDVPCVVALPIRGGNPEYLRWVGENSRG